MSTKKRVLNFDLIDRESDWTIRLRRDKMDQLGIVIWFDGDSDRWILLRHTRVPYIRDITTAERGQLWNRRWQRSNGQPFQEFAKAREAASTVVGSLINEGYEIAAVVSMYDLPSG